MVVRSYQYTIQHQSGDFGALRRSQKLLRKVSHNNVNNCNSIPTGDYSSITGGLCNLINGNSFNFIAGGCANTNGGQYSSILGGCGNLIAGALACAGVFGHGITAVSAGTFHINNLWMAPATYNTYAGTAPPFWFPNGTVYVDTSSNHTLKIQF